MGCGGGKNSNEPSVEAARRRLSVGQVDKKEDCGEAAADMNEDDRGVIMSLNEQALLSLVGNDTGRKFSLGSAEDAGKTSFANKKVAKAGVGDTETQTGLGYTCRKGLKPESPNQDSWMVMVCENEYGIYGVFDGHGQKGHDVSNMVKDTLPKLIIRDSRFKDHNEDQKVLFDAFKKVQSLIVTQEQLKKLEAQLSGTTCSMCIHNFVKNTLTFAHVADSTIVLSQSSGGKHVAVQITRDHKPDLKDERARIEKAGGRVVFDGYANHRIYAKNARYPGLNMSRCLGDLLGHQDCGITCEPETSERTITPDDKFLLLCSDGVWEFMTPQEGVDLVAQSNVGQAMSAAEKLAKEAWDRWIKEEGGAVVDDITVVLIHLNQGKKG